MVSSELENSEEEFTINEMLELLSGDDLDSNLPAEIQVSLDSISAEDLEIIGNMEVGEATKYTRGLLSSDIDSALVIGRFLARINKFINYKD